MEEKKHLRSIRKFSMLRNLMLTYRTEKVFEFIQDNYFMSESMFWKILAMDLGSVQLDPAHTSLAYQHILKTEKTRKKVLQLSLF
jgi:hypothetical protein